MPFRKQQQDNEPELAAEVSALKALIGDLRLELDRRFANQDRLTTLTVETISKTVEAAQTTANKAAVKAEAAAERAYLEAQIDGLRRSLENQMVAQRAATDAAVVSAKDALSAALSASEKAIQKAAEATEKRFTGVNEFRAQLTDQAATFVRKVEVDYRFMGIEKTLEADHQRQHAVDLKFAEYVPSVQLDRHEAELSVWRRAVDAQLIAAQSKSGLIYAAVGTVIAAGALLVGVFNLFTKASVLH